MLVVTFQRHVGDSRQQATPRSGPSLCNLHIVDSVFLGFVCTRPTLAAWAPRTPWPRTSLTHAARCPAGEPLNGRRAGNSRLQRRWRAPRGTGWRNASGRTRYLDENLYLNHAGVIVLVSLGDAGLIELQDRQPLYDTA